jgi:site-specific DNA recombinase
MRPKLTRVASVGERKKAVIYARVSSKEQEKEGYSIPAQLKLLREYASAKDLSVLHEFVDVQTAKRDGRRGFTAMLAFFKKHTAERGVLLVEKTDRLYRTFRDYVPLDELGIEIHFVKESTIISPDSHSSQKLMHVIKVGMAKQYIDNLSEEARKGLREKADEGIFPGKAPLGYSNVKRADGKRVIEPDPNLAPHVTRMYERYSTGLHSIEAVKNLALADGVRFRRTGAQISVATVHNILRSPIYMGEFDWKPANSGSACR